MYEHTQREIEQVVQETEEIIEEATSEWTRENAMKHAYQEIALLIKMDKGTLFKEGENGRFNV